MADKTVATECAFFFEEILSLTPFCLQQMVTMKNGLVIFVQKNLAPLGRLLILCSHRMCIVITDCFSRCVALTTKQIAI